MSERNPTRPRFLQLSGTVAATSALGTGAVSAESTSWQLVASPVDVTLWDVASSARNDFAVGGGGVVVERTEEGWKKVVGDGPTSNGNSLYGADVTDDGERLWFVGSSGAIGEYDVETGTLVNHSAPNDATNNFRDVAVTGPADDANVYVAGDSGNVFYSFRNGASGTWNYVSPGQGAAIKAIDFYDARKGHLVNGNPGSGGGGQEGDAGRMARFSTETSGSKSLTFTLENVGEEPVTIEEFALEPDVQVETSERSGAEVTLAGDTAGAADSKDGFAVDGTLKALDTKVVYDPGTTGQADFGLYDGGNVALTVKPVQEKPSGNYIAATLTYGDDTRETFYFEVTNVNS